MGGPTARPSSSGDVEATMPALFTKLIKDGASVTVIEDALIAAFLIAVAAIAAFTDYLSS
jgi:Flp pilus assembly pilin Flp